MKKTIITLTLATLVLTACDKKPPKPVTSLRNSAAERANQGGAPTAVSSPGANDLKLAPNEIVSELERTGRVVRAKPAVPGQTFAEASDNVRLITVINSKFVTDQQLPIVRINVDVDGGIVTLKGTVKSAAVISRIIQLALTTEGVSEVVSLVRVDPNA